MGILSTGVSSKSRILLSRQHCYITKVELESTLSNFTRLVEKQYGDHTFIETDSNRFLYRPINDFYVFVMTSLDSNMVEDLMVVSSLAEVVQTIVQPLITEENILENVFDLIFYMDELISDGNREAVSIDEINTYIDMESHEEKMHKMIQESKEKEEKERRREIASKLEKHSQRNSHNDHPPLSDCANLETQPMINYQGINITMAQMSGFDRPMYKHPLHDIRTRTVTFASRNKVLDAEAPVVVQIEESCNGNIHLEGDLDILNIQGEIILTPFQSVGLYACLQISERSDLKMRFHPNVDKSLLGSYKIEIQDPRNVFKIGHSTSLVKWRYKSEEDYTFPLSVYCWPITNTNTTAVTVELTNSSSNPEQTLDELTFQILHSRNEHIIASYNDSGVIKQQSDALVWYMDSLKPGESANFEFSADTNNIQNLLPFTLYAKSTNLITMMEIIRCYDKNDGQNITHVVKKQTTYSVTIGE